jgi:SMI1-KNR4 cell-wall
MSMSDSQKAFELIDNLAGADFHGPKPESLILKAEAALGLTLPPTYRAFLSRYGCGSVSGFECYGIIDGDFENSGVPDAIWMTLRQRRSSGQPASLVLVSETGDGGFYAIDLDQKDREGESPIVEWWPQLQGATGNRRMVARDFGAFLLEQVQSAAE